MSKKRELIVKNNLSEYMEQFNIGVLELAISIGTTSYTLNAILHNKFVPSTYLALCLSNYFDCSVNDLFYLEVQEIEKSDIFNRPIAGSFVQGKFKR